MTTQRMRSGFSYLASELKYKKKTDWLVVVINLLGIFAASVNIFTGTAWLFILLGGLNFTVMTVAMLGAYRYLPMSPFTMLNVYGAIARYADFKRQQEVLLAEIMRTNAALGRERSVNAQQWNMIGLEDLKNIRDMGLLILKKSKSLAS